MGNSNNSIEPKIPQSKYNQQIICMVNETSSHKQSLQKVYIRFTKEKFAEQLLLYQLRQKMQKYVLKTMKPLIIEEKYCDNQSLLIKVQFEYYIKLNQITTNQMQTLYLLLAMLYGYGQIYKQTSQKYFAINSNMIGVNRNGQIKVWINQNFARNAFVIQNQENKQPQTYLVKKILNIIETNPYQYLLPNQFKNFKQQQLKTYTFFQAIMVIKKFSRINNFRIPLRLQDIKNQWNKKSTKIKLNNPKNYQFQETKQKNLKRKEAIPVSTSPLKASKNSTLTTTCQSLFTSVKKVSTESSQFITTSQKINLQYDKDFFTRNSSCKPLNNCINQNIQSIQQQESVQIYEPQEYIDISVLNNAFQHQLSVNI